MHSDSCKEKQYKMPPVKVCVQGIVHYIAASLVQKVDA